MLLRWACGGYKRSFPGQGRCKGALPAISLWLCVCRMRVDWILSLSADSWDVFFEKSHSALSLSAGSRWLEFAKSGPMITAGEYLPALCQGQSSWPWPLYTKNS